VVSIYIRPYQRGRILSKVLIRGFGSKACCAGPERRFTGTALSERSSIKSLTIKSLFEKFSSVKLGPLGNMDLPLPPPVLFREAIDHSRELPRPPYYIETRDDP
jgi:hypothetical protein